MGFMKPKSVDYAALQADAEAKAEAEAAADEAEAQKAAIESLELAESKRKAFYAGLASTDDSTDSTKKFLKGV